MTAAAAPGAHGTVVGVPDPRFNAIESLRLLVAEHPQLVAALADVTADVAGPPTAAHLHGCARATGPSETVPFLEALERIEGRCPCGGTPWLLHEVPEPDALRAAMGYRWTRRLLDRHVERLAAVSRRPLFVSAARVVCDLGAADGALTAADPQRSWCGVDVVAHELDELGTAYNRTRRVVVPKLSAAFASAVCSQLRISAPPAPLDRQLLVFCPHGRRPHAKCWHVAAAVWGVSNGVLWVPGWTWPWFERKLPPRLRPLSAQPFDPAEKLADPAGERLDRVALVEVRDPHVAALAAELFAERPALGARQAVRAAAAALS